MTQITTAALTRIEQALLPLAVSDDDTPPPGVAAADWQKALDAARFTLREVQALIANADPL